MKFLGRKFDDKDADDEFVLAMRNVLIVFAVAAPLVVLLNPYLLNRTEPTPADMGILVFFLSAVGILGLGMARFLRRKGSQIRRLVEICREQQKMLGEPE